MADNIDKKVLNVPHLRFPEFSGEWEETELQDIVPNICSGKDRISNNGEVTLYGSTGVIGRTNSVSYKENIVLVARVGANAGQMQIGNAPCGVTDNTLVIDAKEWNFYIYYFLQHYNLNRLVFGSGQPLITGGMLKKIKVRYGCYAERNKITRLLCLIDERIATQNKIIEDLKLLKDAIIERSYYNRSYHPCRIGDVIEQISERNKDKSIDMVLSVSNKQGFINQSEQFEDRIIASEDTSNYKIVHKNDFAYNPARINVGSIARLTTIEKGIVSPMYICFRVRKEVVSEYLEHFFSTSYFFYEMQKRLEGSVRQCLSFEGICNIPIYIPSSEEQHTIGKKISVLLDKIDIETHYHCKLVEQKHYLLRQMFI